MTDPPPPPSGFTTSLRAREEVAEGTMAFHFDRPAGFSFRAGQATDFTLLAPSETDAEGDTRTFSIASPPSANEVLVATRLRDTAFKRVLRTVPLGTAVRVAAPGGNMTLHNDAQRTAVLLTGGIGITPFRSIVLRASIEKLSHKIYLFYSNHRPEDAAFLEELHGLERTNPNYHFIPTMDGMERSRRPWEGEVGHIDRALVDRYLIDPIRPVYYSAGPPAFVTAMRTMLHGFGVDDDDIRTEEFSGY
ncbi:MAG: FAD-dependent oxidoreductase [Thermoplasmata archaeon]